MFITQNKNNYIIIIIKQEETWGSNVYTDGPHGFRNTFLSLKTELNVYGHMVLKDGDTF